MKTKITKQGDTWIVHMDGMINVEATEPLKENLSRLSRRSKLDESPSKIIFNLERLQFVGSSGISSFVQTLKSFNSLSGVSPRYCHVRSEFKRLIEAFDNEDTFKIYENEEGAKKSFDQ